MSNVYLSDWISSQTAAAEALFKFCKDHGASDSQFIFEPITKIQNCLESLKAEDIQQAMTSYLSLFLGKEGFNEWRPPCIYEHETPSYVAAVFGALLSHWVRLMQLSVPNTCAACGKEIPNLRICPSCYIRQNS